MKLKRSRTQAKDKDEILNNMVLMLNKIIGELRQLLDNLKQQQRQKEE